eukprot:3740349-Amphidinium_carterae.3
MKRFHALTVTVIDWAGCQTTRKIQAQTQQQKQNSTLLLPRSTISYANDKQLKPTIYTDSSSAKCLATQLGITKRTKHGDIRYLHVQQLQQEGALRIDKVGTDDNPADLKTKYLATAKLKQHSTQMGLYDKIGSINMITNHHPRPRQRSQPAAPTTNQLQACDQLEVVHWVIRANLTIYIEAYTGEGYTNYTRVINESANEKDDHLH